MQSLSDDDFVIKLKYHKLILVLFNPYSGFQGANLRIVLLPVTKYQPVALSKRKNLMKAGPHTMKKKETKYNTRPLKKQIENKMQLTVSAQQDNYCVF